MYTITESWDVLDAWLAEHAPATLAEVRGPADPAEIKAAEARLGLRFPAELVESLRRHDGVAEKWTYVLPIAPLLSVAEIVKYHEMCMEVAEDVGGFVPRGGYNEPWWHPRWLPFAEVDGNAQVIDLRTGEHRIGETRNSGSGQFTGDTAWPSLAAYFDEVARALPKGEPVSGWQPVTEEDELIWDLADESTEG